MSSDAPPTLEFADCVKLLDSFFHDAGTAKRERRAIRNHCMALLMLDAGLRVGELVLLRMSNLYFDGQPVRTIIIRGSISKSKISRDIPVSAPLTAALVSFRKSIVSPDFLKGDVFAFRNSSTGNPVTTRQVERIIRAASLKSLGRPIHPHVLRHTAASRWMRVTNESVVQRLLGHKYLSSTQIYCHPNSDDLRSAVDNVTSPPAPSAPGPVPAGPVPGPASSFAPGPRPAARSAPSVHPRLEPPL
ncbi:MAG: site-specific integrase [Desulfobacterales bacterium]|nr:site-specific integrase [Desulfobacterales bacterium]